MFGATIKLKKRICHYLDEIAFFYFFFSEQDTKDSDFWIFFIFFRTFFICCYDFDKFFLFGIFFSFFVYRTRHAIQPMERGSPEVAPLEKIDQLKITFVEINMLANFDFHNFHTSRLKTFF